jgi:hypothetical protein
MAELLLINPSKRGRKAPKRRTSAKRRRNPVAKLSAAPKRRRRNPIGIKRVHARRRRNPIAMGGIVAQLKSAAIGGAGSVAVDLLMGQVNGYLPASMQKTSGSLGVYDAVKIGVTIAAGKLLSKPTRGLSQKMAAGALTVQAADIIKTFVPSTMTLGYNNPARVIQGTARVSPNMNRMGFYGPAGGPTPLLSSTPSGMLNGVSARQREGVRVR